MKKVSATAFLAAGMISLGGAAHYHNTRFSNSSIWNRQRPFIESKFHADPAKEQKAFDSLRKGLKQLGDGAIEKRCKFETNFSTLVHYKGDESKAKREIMNKSFEPYENCKESNRVFHTATRWFSIVGIASTIIGAFSLVASAFRRKKENQNEHSE